MPPWHRHNQGRTRSAHTGGRRGLGTCPPSFKHTRLLRTCKPVAKRVTTSPANPGGLIYILPPRISPPPTDPGVSPGARAQFWLVAEAASLLPVPAPKRRGWQKTRGSADRGREAGALSSREGFPGRSGEPAPRPSDGDWPGTAIGRGPHRSPREPGRRGGEEVVAAALHQPCSAGGRMSPGAGSGSEGTGRALGFPPRPGDPQALATPLPYARPWGAARSPEAPRPHTSPVP